MFVVFILTKYIEILKLLAVLHFFSSPSLVPVSTI